MSQIQSRVMDIQEQSEWDEDIHSVLEHHKTEFADQQNSTELTDEHSDIDIRRKRHVEKHGHAQPVPF